MSTDILDVVRSQSDANARLVQRLSRSLSDCSNEIYTASNAHSQLYISRQTDLILNLSQTTSLEQMANICAAFRKDSSRLTVKLMERVCDIYMGAAKDCLRILEILQTNDASDDTKAG